MRGVFVARSFGWVQDSGSFDNLKRILKALCIGSEWHSQLLNKLAFFKYLAKTTKKFYNKNVSYLLKYKLFIKNRWRKLWY